MALIVELLAVSSARTQLFAFKLTGDCTGNDSGTGNAALTCTKTNGTAFGPIATLGIGAGLSSSGGNLLIPGGAVTNAMLAGAIAASNLIGTDIATVGTVTNGTWNSNVKSLTLTKTTNYTVLTTNTGTHFNDAGAAGTVILTLPTAAAGLQYCALVDAAFTVEFLAVGSDKIAVGGVNGAAAGNVQSATPYSAICLESHKALQWAALSSTGTWTLN